MSAGKNGWINQAGWITGCALLMLCLAGCGGADDRKTTMDQYADDGYMGFSTANPGILTSPHARTYVNTTRIVEQALEKVPHIVDSKVFYRGGTVTVRVRVEPELQPYELSALQADAQERLNASLPGYTVKVILKQ